jgi:hypothetical protein
MVGDFANHGIAGAQSRLQAGAPLNTDKFVKADSFK